MPAFRADQLIKWLHQARLDDFTRMTNLPKTLQAQLTEQYTISKMHVAAEHISRDGTVKWLFKVDHKNQVETVFIPEDKRGTLCISSQAGCALACRFCATGMQGFSRNLQTAEIIGQLRYAISRLEDMGRTQRITNVVMMGMGEPLLNLNQLIPALTLMLDDYAYGLSKYRVTVSTSGIVPAMEKLRDAIDVALAVSLHAPTDALRNVLVPINKKYNLATLMQCCQQYFHKQPKRAITMEYIMIDSVNDQPEHARALVKCLQNVRCKINLIPYNPIDGVDYRTSTTRNIQVFRGILERAQLQTTVRKTRGDDIDAACGQLAGSINGRQSKLKTPA